MQKLFGEAQPALRRSLALPPRKSIQPARIREISRRSSLSGCRLSAEKLDGLPDLYPVAGKTAQRLGHIGEHGGGSVPEASPVSTIRRARNRASAVLGRKAPEPVFTSRTKRIEPGRELLAHDGGADEVGAFDRADVVAQSVEHAVGGDEVFGLADDGAAGLLEHAHHLVERELVR